MADNTHTTPTTPTTTTGCRCTERCKCCDAPKRTRIHAPNNNENVKGIDLFGGKKPGPFPNILDE